ncbi:MULE transposase [Hirsutella rhossiliensis]
MASPALIPALPPTLPEPGGELPVDSADEFSESNDCDDFHDNDDWDGYGPANDFVRTLSESKKVWIWGLDWIEDEFRFRHAAWGYHQGGKMWQQFSSCLQIDATFEWFLKQVSRFLRAGIIRSPEVVITDMDDQLRNAIRQIFPNTQLQLCVFHINSNVVSYIKKWWKKDNDSDLDDDAENWDNTDALDVQEMERENTEVKT